MVVADKEFQSFGDMLGGHRILINFVAKCDGTEVGEAVVQRKGARLPK